MENELGIKIEENIEHLYNISLKDEEYELSMKINNSLIEFNLHKKNIIANYNSKFGLENINKLLHNSFKRIKEAFDFFDKIIKDKRIELIKVKEKEIINLKFKNIDNLNNGNDIFLELNKVLLTNEEINIILLKEMNTLKKNEILKIEKSRKVCQKIYEKKIKEKDKEINQLKQEINQLKKTQEKKINDFHIEFNKKISEMKNILKPVLEEFQEKKQKENDERNDYENLVNDFKIINYKFKIPDKNSEQEIFNALNLYTSIFKIKNPNQNDTDSSIYIRQLYPKLNYNITNKNIFREVMMNIFVRELKKTKNKNFKLNLLNILIKEYNNLIIDSYPFMEIIFEFLSSTPKFIGENLRKIQDNNNLCLKLINDENNEILNHILLTIFENSINIYFELIPNITHIDDQNNYFKKYFDYKKNNNEINPTLILSDKSLELFQNCINIIEKIYINREKGQNIIKNDILCQLYAISYIKIYLFKYVYFTHYNNKQFIDKEEILKIINDKKVNNQVRQMIKIYIFRIFFYILGNYHDFYEYDFKNRGIFFLDEIKQRFKQKKYSLLTYYMLPNGDQNKWNLFMEYFNEFDSFFYDKSYKPINQFVNFISNNGIDFFFMITTNLITSNIAVKNLVEKDEYSRYSSFINNLFTDPKIKLPEITKQLFFLFSNEEIFDNKIKKKLIYEQNNKEININQFEMILYGLRFCLQSTSKENQAKFLYSKILSRDCEDILRTNCLPGNNRSENFYIQNYYLLEEHLKNYPSNIGAYVCGCGLYYSIAPCGFPNQEGICVKCGNKIGYDKLPPGIKGCHGFAHVPGHFRIFKDLEQKKYEFSKYGNTDENIPNKLLDEYKREIIDPKLDAEKYGISKISKISFLSYQKKVRDLSQIGYRLLNFILYSHLFYANCLGFIKDEDMAKYLCDGMTCIQMLENDWNYLKDALQSKGIQIIQIFINLIFDKLSEKLKNCKELKTLDQRNEFEQGIEKLLEESYKEYEHYSKIYNKNNEKLLELNKNSLKALVLEINDPNDYNEKQYPFYKYFLKTTYPTRDSFIHEFKQIEDYEKKYPLINNYIRKDNPEKFLIKYLSEFNEFSNFMIDYYSYKISRKDAAQKKIKDEDLYKNNIHNFKDKFKSFIKIWENLKSYSTKFECRDEMPPIDLNENKEIAFFLNDDGDIGKGMYIASTYENFIQWQNNFLDAIIEQTKHSGILHHFVKNMERTINVQNANKNEILNFDITNENFNKLIYKNCKRNIIREDNSINYMNYNQFIYDFDTIEKNLGELLLPGKKKFESVKTLKYVTFCFEGFLGNKSFVLIDFIDKYKQIPLCLEKKQLIFAFIQEKYNGRNEELTNILFLIQMLMNYLTQIIENEKKEIRILLYELPENITLSNEFIELFYNEKIDIKIEEIIGVYSFFELLCFGTIINNLKDIYKKIIDEELSKRILKLFDDKKFNIITKYNLASACRKFISRYLTGSRSIDEFDENSDLSVQLSRYELWTKEIFEKEEDFYKELNYLKEAKITIGQCFELYKLIGGDEEQEFRGIKKKILKEGNNNIESDAEE